MINAVIFSDDICSITQIIGPPMKMLLSNNNYNNNLKLLLKDFSILLAVFYFIAIIASWNLAN